MGRERSCGEALVHLLEGYGVDVVFGIPGVHTLDLYRGLADGRVRHVQARHEQGAGFMADGYARVTGRPGVCFLISGPGVTNGATPLGQAYCDSVPLLMISSATPRVSNTPCSSKARLEDAIAAGVANDSAHGQEMTNTANVAENSMLVS